MAKSRSAEPPLYSRLGGYDVIAVFVDAWLRLLVADPQLRGYFRGMGTDTKRKVRQLTLDFIAERTGGPVIYTGRSIKASHQGLGISRSDYEVLMRHAARALDRARVTHREKSEMLSFLAGLEGDCVEPPKADRSRGPL